jgi:hypothetical protein
MHSDLLPHDGGVTAPAGRIMVRQDLPSHRSVPVGPPEAIQNDGLEQDTLRSAPPGGLSTRQDLPFQICASACLRPAAV